MSCAYYNENDPKTAAWLEELIKAGHIASGVVDTRSIEDVTPGDVRGFTQCHFFAGIGGWSYALRVAGWSDSRPVWTGSCPCQPFSAAGKSGGFTDERHLWPSFFHLIEVCRPAIVFGEQVASPAALLWLDLVSTDLERAGYAVGAADLCAACVGAPHIRQRLYWLAESGSERREGVGLHIQPRATRFDKSEVGRRGETCELADTDKRAGGQGSADARGRHQGSDAQSRAGLGGSGLLDDLGDAERLGLRIGRRSLAVELNQSSHWTIHDSIPCLDGKARPVEPGTFPLAHGVPARVGRLRGYGNAIVPQVAAAFIQACLE